MKPSQIGGQAVLEGVMMKYKSNYSVAVRKPDGGINVIHGKCKSISDRPVFLRLPIIRGITSFINTLILGAKTLTYSADFIEEEEDKADMVKNNAINNTDNNNGNNIEQKQDNGGKNNLGVILAVAFPVIMATVIFIVLPFFLSQLLNPLITSPALLSIAEGVMRIVLFMGYILMVSMVPDVKRVLMYHGAEHKSINCVENGLELTIENVRKQSKHHKRCGTSFIFIVVFISIVCFMFIHFENIWLRILSRFLLVPVIAGVSYEFILFAGSRDNKIITFLSMPGILLQRITTREPDDKMIEVAIASIEEIFDWEAYQRWLRTEKARQEEKARRAKSGVSKKSRAQIKEELLKRELENKQRATERARQIREMEEKEAELERIAEEARKRKEARKAVTLKTDLKDESLAKLDHFLDLSAATDGQEMEKIQNGQRTEETKTAGVSTAKEDKKNNTARKSGAKVINLSDYK